MASELQELSATTRARTGKGAARQARREGLVPGIVYGGNIAPVPINLKYNELIRRLNAGRFLATLFDLKIDGSESTRVICRAVQRDVVRDLPTHVDFMRLHGSSRIKLFIPVRFMNEEDAPGLRRGGVLTVVRNEVELLVTANNIPEHIDADLSDIDVGDVLTISDVVLPEGASPTIKDRDFVIANISAPSGLRSTEQDEPEEEIELEPDQLDPTF